MLHPTPTGVEAYGEIPSHAILKVLAATRRKVFAW